jgi:predicted amidophosphoribosyltransferase
LKLEPDVIVPVPLHASRKRQRGYNQAELLALRCARRLRLPYEPSLLTRVRATPPQLGLTGKRVLLLDDVTTTGSTLDAAAFALVACAPAALLGIAVTRPDLTDDARDALLTTPATWARRGRRP